ncbi:MAG TPA: hypothetical protein VG815_12055 [Chloroflexota bacterium]|jgi:hypothetical protein|nr:hypothetical protein [Chloroflexota bacterium]
MIKIRSSIGRAVLGLAILTGAAAGTTIGIYQASASTPVPISAIQEVNQSGQAFGVVFTTASWATASLQFGNSCANATTSVNEVPNNGYNHLINVPGGLAPATTYYFKLTVGGILNDNGGYCFEASTLADQSVPPVPSTVYGILKTDSCTNPVSGGLVEVNVGKTNGSTSETYATITGSNGTFALPFAETAMPDGSYSFPVLGDDINLSAHAWSTRNAGANVTYNGKNQVVGPETLCTAQYS